MSNRPSAPRVGGAFGEFEGLARVVRAGARDDRHIVDGLDDRLDDADVLVVGQGRRLSRRADGDEPVDARGLEALGVGLQCFEVNSPVFVEGRASPERRPKG